MLQKYFSKDQYGKTQPELTGMLKKQTEFTELPEGCLWPRMNIVFLVTVGCNVKWSVQMRYKFQKYCFDYSLKDKSLPFK